MSYTLGWSINVVLLVLAILEAGIGAMKAIGAADLGISPVVLNWALVVNGMCIAAAAALPGLFKTPQEHDAQLRALGKKRASDRA